MNLCCFRPLRLWRFVIAAAGNEYTGIKGTFLSRSRFLSPQRAKLWPPWQSPRLGTSHSWGCAASGTQARGPATRSPTTSPPPPTISPISTTNNCHWQIRSGFPICLNILNIFFRKIKYYFAMELFVVDLHQQGTHPFLSVVSTISSSVRSKQWMLPSRWVQLCIYSVTLWCPINFL